MKTKIVLGACFFPVCDASRGAGARMVQALEYDTTARETREQYVEEQLAKLQAALTGDGELPSCLLMPLKWLVHLAGQGADDAGEAAVHPVPPGAHPVVLFARLISLPFRALEFFMMLLNPFDGCYGGCCPG